MVYTVAGEKFGTSSASAPSTIASAYIASTAPRWPRPRFESRCAVWSLPGEVKGNRPRRAREMETSVVSKIGTPRISTGTSHVCGNSVPSGRIFSPSVAIRNPRNIAPPSPIKIFAGLKFQRRKSKRGAQSRGGESGNQRLPVHARRNGEETRGDGGDSGAKAVHVIENAESGGDADDPHNGEAPIENQSAAPGMNCEKSCARMPEAIRKIAGERHANEKFYLVMQQPAVIEEADEREQTWLRQECR